MTARIFASSDQISAALDLSVQFTNGSVGRAKAIELLVAEHGFTARTAAAYIDLYPEFLHGRFSKLTVSSKGVHMALSRIQALEPQNLEFALQGLQKKIDYEDNMEPKGKVRGLRKVLSEFQQVVALRRHTETPEEADKNFQDQLAVAIADTPANRSKRLSSAPRLPRIGVREIQYFYRNPDVAAEVLLRASGNCEACKRPAPFISKATGSPYLEVHHRTPLASGGEDTVENCVAVCPNCHRSAHFGTINSVDD